MNICKAIIREGKNKGKKCDKNNINEHGYCGKHLRNKKYDEGIENNIRFCRFFFRGCDNEITNESENILTCKSCLEIKKKDVNNCKHKGCTFKAKDKEKFCRKHERDKYRLEEKEKNIHYCDIDRGCFTICNEGMSSCEKCLQNSREKDNERVKLRKKLNRQLQSLSDKRVCQKCGQDYDVFKTSHNKDSTKCKKCFKSQQKIEDNRNDRNRNYKEERKKFLETYFKMFINESFKRDKNVELNFDEYSKLVQSSCYYCGYYNKNEAIGIDRINNTLHYTKENCISCCETCNRIKYIYHPIFFIEKAKIISKNKEATKEFYDKWQIYYTRSKNNLYNKYKKETEEKRNMKFLLTEMEWDKLIRQPCYLCGYKQVEGLGLDRFDNSIREYNINNCKPCCGGCNSMKHDMNYNDFINHTKKISDKWITTTELENIPIFNNPFRKNIIELEYNVDKKERVRWTSNGLYYAILSDLENDFINFYNDIIKDNEVQILKEEILIMSDKEEALKKISTYLNTLNMRRKRSKIEN
jgi:hypothetical protein